MHDARQANIAAHATKETTAAAVVVADQNGDEHDIEACRSADDVAAKGVETSTTRLKELRELVDL